MIFTGSVIFDKEDDASHHSENCNIDEAMTFQCLSAGCSVNHCEALEDKANNVPDPYNGRRLISKCCKRFSTAPLHKGKLF